MNNDKSVQLEKIQRLIREAEKTIFELKKVSQPKNPGSPPLRQ